MKLIKIQKGERNINPIVKLPFMQINLMTMEVNLNGQKNTKYQLIQLAKEEKRRNYDSRRVSGS